MKKLDKPLIEDAIREAERDTTGEVRVSVAVFFWGSVKKVAERAFMRLGMSQTSQRNGVLIFVVPSRRRYHILCDSGIPFPEREELTRNVSNILTEHFKKGEYSTGLVKSVKETARILRKIFPSDSNQNINELPDEIDHTRLKNA